MEEVTYWRKEMETLPREKLAERQLKRFKERMHVRLRAQSDVPAQV